MTQNNNKLTPKIVLQRLVATICIVAVCIFLSLCILGFIDISFVNNLIFIISITLLLVLLAIGYFVRFYYIKKSKVARMEQGEIREMINTPRRGAPPLYNCAIWQ